MQTLATADLVSANGIEIVQVGNQRALPSAEPEGSSREVADLLGDDPAKVVRISAKTGLNVTDVLDAIVERGIESGFLTHVGVSKNEDVRFASETLRRVLNEEMTPRRRQRAHQGGGLAIEERYARGLGRIARALRYHPPADYHPNAATSGGRVWIGVAR